MLTKLQKATVRLMMPVCPSAWNNLGVRNVSDKSCKENRNAHFIFNNSHPPPTPPKKKIVLFMRYVENVVEPDRSQMTIWRMPIACWITEAVNTHLQYVILTAFALQLWLHEPASLLNYVHFPSCFYQIQPDDIHMMA